MDILSLLNVQLNAVLRQLLPQIESDWWHLLVLEKLTYQQQSFAQKLPNNALEQLDLSALLRVIDQNWYELAELCHFSKDARNWLKEAQSIRNRWAHIYRNEICFFGFLYHLRIYTPTSYVC